MSSHGIIEPHLVTGTSKRGPSNYLNQHGEPAKNITAAEYADVLDCTLLPGGEDMSREHGVRHWVLQQDNILRTAKLGSCWVSPMPDAPHELASCQPGLQTAQT
jgi:hypothetical protein